MSINIQSVCFFFCKYSLSWLIYFLLKELSILYYEDRLKKVCDCVNVFKMSVITFYTPLLLSFLVILFPTSAHIGSTLWHSHPAKRMPGGHSAPLGVLVFSQMQCLFSPPLFFTRDRKVFFLKKGTKYSWDKPGVTDCKKWAFTSP